jgi:voltage-gated potassium channel
MPKKIIDNLKKKEVELKPWQQKINEIIAGTETRLGKLFDLWLLVIILVSVVVIMLESVPSIQKLYAQEFIVIEFVITGLFSIEYILRIISTKQPLKYMFSFLGVVDLLSILPTYLGLFISGTKPLTVIRALRFLRIFRILELSNFTMGADTIIKALYASRHKIVVFIISMLTIVIILGAIMFSIESPEAGFTSIPRSIYWAIITITTVGYGDIAPMTPAGQALASIIMLIGYSIIAVPTGIVSAEIVKGDQLKYQLHACPSCKKTGHELEAEFCKFCGGKL